MPRVLRVLRVLLELDQLELLELVTRALPVAVSYFVRMADATSPPPTLSLFVYLLQRAAVNFSQSRATCAL